MASPQAEAIAYLERVAGIKGVRMGDCQIEASRLSAARGPDQIQVQLVRNGHVIASTTAVDVITDRW